jgi:alpha-galactosidase
VEWEFGNIIGDYHDAKVLLIKTSWGGASIRRKFRPPSSGEATELIEAEYGDRLKRYEKERETKPDAKKPERKEVEELFGQNYRKMVESVREILASLETVVPGYQGEGYEMAGFVWFQGFNDQFGGAEKEYATHLANLIRDVRREFESPRLPVVIGQMGHGGTVEEREERGLKPIGDATRAVKEAQASVAAMDEFEGTVALVRTDVFWDWKAQEVFDTGWREHLEEWKKIGAHFPYHYLGSPVFFFRAGQGFGKAMVELHREGSR